MATLTFTCADIPALMRMDPDDSDGESPSDVIASLSSPAKTKGTAAALAKRMLELGQQQRTWIMFPGFPGSTSTHRRLYGAQQRRALAQPCTLSDTRQVMHKKEPTFTDMPGEIRNLIYQHVLVTASPRRPDYSLAKPLQALAEPGLIHASRQIRNETLAIYYGDNSFRFCPGGPDKSSLRGWVQRIGPKASLLRQVEYEILVGAYRTRLSSHESSLWTVTFSVAEWPRTFMCPELQIETDRCRCEITSMIKRVLIASNEYTMASDGLYALDADFRSATYFNGRHGICLKHAPEICTKCGKRESYIMPIVRRS